MNPKHSTLVPVTLRLPFVEAAVFAKLAASDGVEIDELIGSLAIRMLKSSKHTEEKEAWKFLHEAFLKNNPEWDKTGELHIDSTTLKIK